MKIISQAEKTESTHQEKIKSIGLGFVALGFALIPVLGIVINETQMSILTYVVIAQMVFFIATGIGAYHFKKWSYRLLFASANFLSLAFPIGTYFGIKLYRYLKMRGVKELFGIDLTEAA